MDKSNWLQLHMESENSDGTGGPHLSFDSAGGPWWNENYLDSLYEDLYIMEQEESELAEAFKKHPYCIVMVYGCAIQSVLPSWTAGGFDMGEAYMDYTDIEVRPI